MSDTETPTERDSVGLSRKDEALLTWYFCEGQSYFERSTFGDTLERQKLFAFQSEKCERCGGHGFNNDDLRGSTEKLKALEFLRTPTGDREQTFRNFKLWEKRSRECSPKCDDCDGSGRIEERRIGVTPMFASGCPICCGTGHASRGNDCESCDGTGAYGSYDARDSSDDDWEPSYTPDDVALTRYAIASRRLGKADAMRAGTSAVLGAFYGVLGAKWAAPDPRNEDAPVPGRIFAVFPLTRLGISWASKQENPNNLAGHEIIGNDWIAHSQQPTAKRKAFFDSCRHQANDLYRQAVRVWLRCQGGPRDAKWEDSWSALKKQVSKRRAA